MQRARSVVVSKISFTTTTSSPFLPYSDLLDPQLTPIKGAIAIVTETSKWGVQVTGLNSSGVVTAASAWTVALQGCLNGYVYTNMVTHVSGTNANGSINWSSGNFYPVTYIAINVSALTLGSAAQILVDVYGVE